MTGREGLVSQAFVPLADSLVDEFDVSAAGILLDDPDHRLQVVAASSEQARVLELLQRQANEGPCLDCHTTGQTVSAEDLATTSRWPRAFADVATIAILQDQAVRDAEVRARRLQHALDSRVVIEQAKGMPAEHAELDMDQAFRPLRAFARVNNRRLTTIAASLVAGEIELGAVSGHPAAGLP